VTILAVTVASLSQFQQLTRPGENSRSCPSISQLLQVYAAKTRDTRSSNPWRPAWWAGAVPNWPTPL